MRIEIHMQIDQSDAQPVGNVYEKEIVEFLFGEGGPGLQALDQIRAKLRSEKNSSVHFWVTNATGAVWFRETTTLGDADHPHRELIL